MGRKDHHISGDSPQVKVQPTKKLYARFLKYSIAFLLGAAVAGSGFTILHQTDNLNKSSTSTIAVNNLPGNRTVAKLMALSDAELEKVDVVEMSVAVAREIPGCENLNYQHYKQIVDGWAGDVRRWMPAAEVNFHISPQQWRSDINFFRLGLLATYLTRERGIRYAEKYSQEQKEGKNSRYEDPGAVLVHGLVDTLRGTCATMPVLHVAIGRRLGWPVSLAAVGPHYVCRYDDGKVHYNIEATYTGPGFVSDSDEDYIKNDHLPRKAVTTGSDFRSLTVREMLGVFIGMRARYYWDTGQYDAADRDYVLARVLYPNHRYCFRESLRALIWRGEQLFEPNETGHPADLARFLVSTYLRPSQGSRIVNQAPYEPPMVNNSQFLEPNRINAMSRANMQPQTPGIPQPVMPSVPQAPSYIPRPQQSGFPQPGIPQPYQPPMPGQPPR